jgi:hypothetical protein
MEFNIVLQCNRTGKPHSCRNDNASAANLRKGIDSISKSLCIEEYSVTYTITDALAGEPDPAVRNSAHISVGSRVLARVTLEGREVPLRSNFCEELASSMNCGRQEGSGLAEYLSGLIALLCMLFPLEMVILSGRDLPAGKGEQELNRRIGSKMPHSPMPILKILRPALHSSGAAAMAAQVRRRVLAAL